MQAAIRRQNTMMPSLQAHDLIDKSHVPSLESFAHPHSKVQNTKFVLCDHSVIAKMLVIEITPKINLSLKFENEFY
jgi:hypothetical protein